MNAMTLERDKILPEADLPKGADLVAEGRAMARDWPVGPCAFLAHAGAPSEAAYKRACAEAGRVMCHAQMGFRDAAKSIRAYGEIHEACERQGATVDRYGIALDWSMGYPAEDRNLEAAGTGLILSSAEEFCALTAAAPVAPHFGDFILGFPAALENTRAALAAGSTSIGNIGQYFTFRLPGWDDDVATTKATLTALGLIAGQDVEILVHSNLDDGFAALFNDTACALGAALIEQHVIGGLIGANLSHCYGHHFSNPERRLAFHLALREVSDTPGTMVYGNTMGYRGSQAANYASLASYLLVDVLAQKLTPSGHAINPVPVSENERIPDIDEIVDAQVFAARLIEHADGHLPLAGLETAGELAGVLVKQGKRFRDRVLTGLEEAGIDTGDPFEMLLALKRIGGKRLEELFGPGARDEEAPRGRRPVIPSPTLEEIEALTTEHLKRVDEADRKAIVDSGLVAIVATSDVHEHGKLLVEQVFRDLGIRIADGGVSTDPDDLVDAAIEAKADVIALSTYNGVALSFLDALNAELKRRGKDIPVLIGGKLNQVPTGSNTSLPVDVSDVLVERGALIAREIEDAAPALAAIAGRKQAMTEQKAP